MSTKNANMSKADRREAARAEALALRSKQSASDRRNRIITFSVLGVAVLGLAIVIWMILQEGQKSAMEKVENVPSSATVDGTGIPIGAEGAGTPNEGATEIGSYVDFLCPHCAEFESVNGEDLSTMVEGGDATLVLHPVAIVDPSSDGLSVRAAAAFAWVADNAPEQAFPYQEVLFQNQPAGGSDLTDQQLADLAEGVGVPEDVAASIGDGTAHDTYGEWVEAVTDEILADDSLKNPESGGFGTPTITLDGERWAGNWGNPGELLAAVTG